MTSVVPFVMTADEERKARKALATVGHDASQDTMNDIRRRLWGWQGRPNAAQWARDHMITEVLCDVVSARSPIPDDLFGVSH